MTEHSDGKFWHSIPQPEVCTVVVVRPEEHKNISSQPESEYFGYEDDCSL